MAKCELNCHECKIGYCSFKTLNAFDFVDRKNPAIDAMFKRTQTRAQLHTRIDAKTAGSRLRGTSGGGVGIGVPAAIETEPELYVTDQLKAQKNFKKEEGQ